MSKVLLCLGSNRDALRHIDAAQNMLRRTLGDIRFSQSLWTKPIGTATPSPLYLNCLAQADTNLGYPALHQMLKDMERTIGSTPTERKQGIVRIDIDMLLADGQRHHEDDWERPYVKNLLAQL